MKAKHQTITGVNIVSLTKIDDLKTDRRTLILVNDQPNGFLAAILTSTINATMVDGESINRKALDGFHNLLTLHAPTKAAHLWGEEFYDEYTMFKHENPLINAAIVQVDTTNNMTHFFRVAENETWVKQNNVWVDVFPENMLTGKGEKILSDINKSKSNDKWVERMEQLDDLTLWKYPLMGLTDSPVLGYKRMPFNGMQAIVIGSGTKKFVLSQVEKMVTPVSKKMVLPETVASAILIQPVKP